MCVEYLIGGIESIDSGSSSLAAWPFILCMEQKHGDPTYGQSCFNSSLASSVNFKWADVTSCSSKLAYDIQAAGEKATPSNHTCKQPGVLIATALLYIITFNTPLPQPPHAHTAPL